MDRGIFVTFEGGEGTGKTTQIEMLAKRLEKAFHIEVITTKEPGFGPIGQELRRILLDPETGDLQPQTELFMFEADRSEHCAQIRKWLAECKIVLCDRHDDSTSVYQGFGGGLNLEMLENLHTIATAGLEPDLTLVFDIDPKIGLERACGRGKLSRFDAKSLDYHQRIRAGFLWIAQTYPERAVLIDATPDKEAVHKEVWIEFMERSKSLGIGGLLK